MRTLVEILRCNIRAKSPYSNNPAVTKHGQPRASKLDSRQVPSMWIPVLTLLGLSLIQGCSSIPQNIAQVSADSPSISSVRSDPASHQSESVRWGGVVISVENQPEVTLVQIIGRRLDRNGRPMAWQQSSGRFIARVDGFLDPEVYTKEREITIIGALDGTLSQKIGQADYMFPLVAVENHHLWDLRNERFARRGYYGGPYHGHHSDRHGYPYHHGFLFSDWWGYHFGRRGHGHRGHGRLHINLNWSG